MNATPMIDLFVVRLDCKPGSPLMAVLGAEPDFNIRGCTDKPAAALAQVTKTPPAVVLVSHDLPEGAALQLVHKLSLIHI